MNLDLPKIAQCARLTVRKACRKLEARGFSGEAARAVNSCDLWRDEAAAMIAGNAPKLRDAKARHVIRELSVIIYNRILRVELAAAMKRERQVKP